MVKYIKYTKAFLQLIRTQNLLIMAATMFILRYWVFVPLLENDGFKPQLPRALFFLLVSSTVFIAAAGYVINDYFDRKTDLINRPQEVILGRLLSLRAGMFWHVLLTGLGVLQGAYVSYKIGHVKFTIIFILVSGLLWFYSTTYKRQVLLGNVIVAFLVALVPLMLLIFELPLLLEKYQLNFAAGKTDTDILVYWVLGYSIFAFLLTLIREITKDLEDFEGDTAYGRQTIPIAWGNKVAKLIVVVMVLITISLLAVAMYKYRYSLLTLAYGAILVATPLALSLKKLLKSSKKQDYRKVSQLQKLTMLAGIFYAITAAYWVF